MSCCRRSVVSLSLCNNSRDSCLHHKLAFTSQPFSTEDTFLLLKEKLVLHGLHYHSALPTDLEAHALTCFESLLTLHVDMPGVFCRLIKGKMVWDSLSTSSVECLKPQSRELWAVLYHPSELFSRLSLVQGCHSPNFPVPLLAHPGIVLFCVVCLPRAPIFSP